MKSLVIAAAALAAVAGVHAESAVYNVDPSHTFAFWEIGHFGTSTNRGRLPVKEGLVQFDRAGKAAKAEITIDTTAPNSGVAALDKHLASKDFFDAGQFPTARFVAEKFVFSGDKVAEAVGTLTLLGKTHPVTLKATNFNCYQNPMLKREVCGGDFETTIARSQWGMNWGLNYGFPDNVKLLVQVEAVKQ